jgi:hypothetical protein
MTFTHKSPETPPPLVRFALLIAAALACLPGLWGLPGLPGLPGPAYAQGRPGTAPIGSPAGGPAAPTAPASAPRADERPTRREIWDIEIGAKVADLPDDFVDYACGTNGGPPSTPLPGWKDFRRCRPEPGGAAGAGGFREVYFRYDDEIEYWAKANNLAPQMEQYIGTKTYGFPIIASALIGEDGVVRGIRIVTDPRDPTGDRDEAYLLRNFLNARFGRDDWMCQDLPAEPGETPVAGIFIKQRCDKDMAGGLHGVLVTRYLRKPGQSQYDPHSGKETLNQFDSNVRFELVRMK